MAEKMLIIDDEEIVLKSCRKIFEAEGFDVVTTASPQEGLKLASDSHFDVILVDWMMPGFDGMDVVEEIDRRSPGFCRGDDQRLPLGRSSDRSHEAGSNGLRRQTI